jgi:uncharacterized protein (TIGR02118 family)
MPTISVIYPRAQGATFDFDHYRSVHMPLVAKRWGDAGLTGAEALRGMSGADGGEAPYFAITLLRFASIEAFGAAMGGEHAAEIVADIANFTNVQPAIQVNETIA